MVSFPPCPLPALSWLSAESLPRALPGEAGSVTPSHGYWRLKGVSRKRKSLEDPKDLANGGKRRTGHLSLSALSDTILMAATSSSFPRPALLCLPLSHCLFINRRRDCRPPPWGTCWVSLWAGSQLVQRCPIPKRQTLRSETCVALALALTVNWSPPALLLLAVVSASPGTESGREGAAGRKSLA